MSFGVIGREAPQHVGVFWKAGSLACADRARANLQVLLSMQALLLWASASIISSTTFYRATLQILITPWVLTSYPSYTVLPLPQHSLPVPTCTALPSAPSPASPTEQQPPSSSGSSITVDAPAPGPSSAVPPIVAASADAPPTTSTVPVPPEKYVPSPIEPGWEVYAGFLAGIIPFAIGSWEFGKRIVSVSAAVWGLWCVAEQ
eukprot:459024-Pelagomonas_calceolata.AAC.3